MRAPRDRTADEAGVSLIELLVTIVLMGILGSMVFGSVLGLTRAVQVADTANFDQGFGRNAMRLVARDLRAAAPVSAAEDAPPAFRVAMRDEVEFTALLGTGRVPDLVHVEVDAESQLLVTATEPDPDAAGTAYDPADEAQRYVASFIVNETLPTPEPIYRFYDAAGVELTDFTGAGGSLTLAHRRRIAQVEVTLHLNNQPGISGVDGATELTTTVRLPNAGARS